MAITANTSFEFRNLSVANYDSLPVVASAHVYQGGLIGINSSGYVTQASDSASLVGVGMSDGEADNTNGSSGDLYVNVYTSGEFAMQTTGSVVYGDAVYVNTDLKVCASGSLAANGVYVGHAMEAHEDKAGYIWVRFDGPKKSGYTGVI